MKPCCSIAVPTLLGLLAVELTAAAVDVPRAAPIQGAAPAIEADRSAIKGIVRLTGRSFADERGPFLGLGASYFLALRNAKFDRPRLHSDLALLASAGFNYVRVFSMVGWPGLEIAPVTFTNRAGQTVPGWSDYWPQFRDLLDAVAARGLRAEITIFADAQMVMADKSARRAHLDGILDGIAGREQTVVHLEVANEAWQNGFPGESGASDLREFTRHLADRTAALVAISSPADTSDAGITGLYRNSAADLATVHFSRDTRTPERGWLPVRDCFRAAMLPGVPPVSSNEPIGPGSSVNSESDPIKLCSAAIFAYVAGLSAYVFHSRAGIYGHEQCCPPSGELRFEDAAGIRAFQHLRALLPPDVASWTRNDGREARAPFTVFCGGEPNRNWPEVPGAVDGCVRNIGCERGREFIAFPMGILSAGVTLEARCAVSFRVRNPLNGAEAAAHRLKAGERVTLPPGPGAWLIRGEFLDSRARPAARN